MSLMKAHRSKYGVSGNCFDLAIWLHDEFTKDGIQAYPIGHDLQTEDAHVAVIAVDEQGKRFLCDLGDQWLQPILIDAESENYTNEKLGGYFPAAEIQVCPGSREVEILYHRPNGKVSSQTYDTEPIDMSDFLKAAEYSQNKIKSHPLLECRIPYKDEIAHWEFNNWKSYLSTSEGLFKEEPLVTIEEWAERINKRSGFKKAFLVESLNIY